MKSTFFRTAMVALLAAIAVSANATNSTYYSKVTVSSSSSANGLVYVSDAETSSPAYAASAEKNQQSSASSVPTHSYHLYAQPADGKVLIGWMEGNSILSTDLHYALSLQADSKESGSPTTKSIKAQFGDKPAVTVASENNDLGSVTLDKLTNKIGDIVTLTATPIMKSDNVCPNFGIKFRGWRDPATGEIVSKKNPYKFKIEKEQDLVAVFEIENSIQGAGYFRVGSFVNSFLKLCGDIEKNFSMANADKDLDPDLEWFLHPLTYSYGYNPSAYINVNAYSDPSMIFYVDGTLDASVANNYSLNKVVMDNVVISCQDTPTSKFLTGIAAEATLQLRWSNLKGQYQLIAKKGTSVAAFKWVWSGKVHIGNATNDSYDAFCFYPVDEAHADENWFAAFPSEEMEHDGGYWCTMFTAFPYQCYEEDGLEAYYVSELKAVDGEGVARLVKLDDGIVPPATPVLLKCRDIIDTTEYFSVKGASPDPANRMIPLLPSAELTALAEEIAADNALHGEYQLMHDATNPGYTTFDGSRMRVMSVNGEGEVGFYRLSEGEVLGANRAWLDISSLPAGVSKVRIAGYDEDLNGITTVTSDQERPADDNIYDLTGRRVANPRAGSIYIKNGKKLIWR